MNVYQRLRKLTGPLYNKLKPIGQIFFNSADIKLIRKIKSTCYNLPTLTLPLQTNYKIVKTDSLEEGWGIVLYCKPSQYSKNSTERIYRYSSSKYKEKGQLSSLDFEILGVINAINSFKLFLNKSFTLRTDCEAIVKFYGKMNNKKHSTKRHKFYRYYRKKLNKIKISKEIIIS